MLNSLNPSVIANADQIASNFEKALPFKHLCIDSFLQESLAVQLIEEFPPYREEETKTEHGGPGRKLVKPQISSYGHGFRQIAQLFSSSEFLEFLSKITGIPDLIWGGESMYGGGTHDNADGAELDQHVDFNYDDRTGLHRRINALIFLNREWQPEWGGQSELSENPWDPDNHNIKCYDPIWNRLILFETTEQSWHGFPRIKLPEDKKHLSRRSLAAYFYTKTRPSHEIFGGHATFYVHRHMPQTVRPGTTLSKEDYDELQHIIKKRDTFLRLKQQKETELGGRLARQRNLINSLELSLRLPLVGYWSEEAPPQGLLAQGRISASVKAQLRAWRPASIVRLKAFAPLTLPPSSTIELRVGEAMISEVVNPEQKIEIVLPVKLVSGQCVEMEIASPHARSGKDAGINNDERIVGLILKHIVLE